MSAPALELSQTATERIAWAALGDAQAIAEAYSVQTSSRWQTWAEAKRTGPAELVAETFAAYLEARTRRDFARDALARARHNWREVARHG